jgi:DNA-binding MarR family transcriptional regulator
MGKHVQLGVCPLDKFPVIPNDAVALIEGYAHSVILPFSGRGVTAGRTLFGFASQSYTRYVSVALNALQRARRREALSSGLGHDHFVQATFWVTKKPKYVNMADITVSKKSAPPPSSNQTEPQDALIWDLIELLFFAYRDFVGDPDEALAKLGFGRAHHRVLHFVNRNPGMKVAELLDILKITKQSLGRVLKQLVDKGYVIQKEGATDRRQRLLYATPKGEGLAMKLAGMQTRRFARALAELGPSADEAARRFLIAMINAEGRERVLRFIARADRAQQTRG